MIKTNGIHHITSISGHPQENMDFYGKLLGLRFVKKTVNFDDPNTYHFYFGDDGANPGTIITFFPLTNARKGRIGDGQVGTTTYIIPEGSYDFWKERLIDNNIDLTQETRFAERYLQFSDTHGLRIELVERSVTNKSNWEVYGISKDQAIVGFGGAVLLSHFPQETKELLTDIFGFQVVKEEGDYVRLSTPGELGNIIDIRLSSSGKGITSVGTVHHIAMRTKDDIEQINYQDLLKKRGYAVTEVRDRNYFKSIYFREKGGILFEIATDGPGFTIDEDLESLGSELILPKQYEHLRSRLEESLIPVKLEV